MSKSSSHQSRRTPLSLSGSGNSSKPGHTNGKSTPEHAKAVKQQQTLSPNGSGHSRSESQKAVVEKKPTEQGSEKSSSGHFNGVGHGNGDPKSMHKKSEKSSADAAPPNGNAAAAKQETLSEKAQAAAAKSNEDIIVGQKPQEEQKITPKKSSTSTNGSQAKKPVPSLPSQSTEPKPLDVSAKPSTPVVKPSLEQIVKASLEQVDLNAARSAAKSWDKAAASTSSPKSSDKAAAAHTSSPKSTIVNTQVVSEPQAVVPVEMTASGAAAQNMKKTVPHKGGRAKSQPKQINVEDVEMPSLVVEDSPERETCVMDAPPVMMKPHQPAATSTPGKVLVNARSKSEVQLAMEVGRSPPDRSSCPRTFAQISGRRSIRPTEFVPAYFDSKTHFRESYRRINTELDVTANTNTSMDVTVGSEVPNNSSFSFFGRRRKRDRTPPGSQSAMGLQTDALFSPPKRARLGVFFSAVASPLTTLRSRFSKTTLQSSTPVKLAVDDVQNVSGVSIEEHSSDADVTVGKEASEQLKEDVKDSASIVQIVKDTSDKKTESDISTIDDITANSVNDEEKYTITDGGDNKNTSDDIIIRETPVSSGKKRCTLM